MSDDLDKYKKLVVDQQEILLAHLARLGIASEFDWDIRMPDEDSPLAELFFALKIAAENLALISRERDQTLKEARDQVTIIKRQRQAILELSTPVIPIWDEILVLPLIGNIDTQHNRVGYCWINRIRSGETQIPSIFP